LIAGKEPQDAALDAAIAKLYDKTKLADEKVRLELFDKAKPAALAASADPIVRMMSKLYPALRAVDDRRKARDGKLLLLKPRYLEALLAFKGGAVAPDANSTLRVAYGTVKKAPDGEPGANIGAFTSVAEMAKKNSGKEPFNAPARLLAAAKTSTQSRFVEKSIADVPVDFLSGVQPDDAQHSRGPTLHPVLATRRRARRRAAPRAGRRAVTKAPRGVTGSRC